MFGLLSFSFYAKHDLLHPLCNVRCISWNKLWIILEVTVIIFANKSFCYQQEKDSELWLGSLSDDVRVFFELLFIRDKSMCNERQVTQHRSEQPGQTLHTRHGFYDVRRQSEGSVNLHRSKQILSLTYCVAHVALKHSTYGWAFGLSREERFKGHSEPGAKSTSVIMRGQLQTWPCLN